MKPILFCLLMMAATGPEVRAQGGDSYLTAKPLGELKTSLTISGRVNSTRPVEYYSFEIAGGVSELILRLKGTGFGSSVAATLSRIGDMDSQELILEQLDSSGSQDAVARLWLDRGTYLVSARPNRGGDVSYQVILGRLDRFQSPGNADNGFDSATPLGLGKTISDYVGQSDPVDNYRFVVEGQVAEVKVGVPRSASTGNVNLGIYRRASVPGQFELLEEASFSSGNGGTISLWLDPGEYFASIVPWRIGQGTTYDITVGSTPRPESSGNGDNDFASAKEVQMPSAHSDYVGRSDRGDFFRFAVSNSVTEVTVSIAAGSVSEELLFSIHGDPLGGSNPEALASTYGSVSGGRLSLWLDPGKYIVIVEPYRERGTTYQLLIAGKAKLESQGIRDNTPETARQIAMGVRIDEFVGSPDPIDYYLMSVTSKVARVAATVTTMPPGTWVNFSGYRASSNGLLGTAVFSTTGVSRDVQSVWLDEGDYLIAVQRSRDEIANYELLVTSEVETNSWGNLDNGFNQARNLGYLGDTILVDDFVGYGDLEDVFRFEVSGPPRRVSASLPRRSMTDSVLLELYRSSPEPSGAPVLVRSTSGSGGVDGFIGEDLSEGVYWVRARIERSGNTGYSLILARTFDNQVPFIVRQPVVTRGSSGSEVVISVTADGSGPLSYQWKFDGRAVSGAVESTWTMSTAGTSEGIHTVSVVVQNLHGKTESDPVSFRLGEAPEPSRLQISRMGTGEVILSWPWVAGSMPVVESASSPEGPWSADDATILGVGDTFKVMISTKADRRFYRLRE